MAANVEAMVNEGVNAFKAGRKEEARALLLKATELDQFNEQAWLWLSGLMDGPDDQRTCLENVLAINPNNERAIQGLAYLTGQPSAGSASSFGAGAPPSAPSSSAPTSVEWGGESPATPAWNRPAPVEPSPAALDDWVNNLNLPIDSASGPTPAFTNSASNSASPSPFGDFDMDEDVFAGGPFSAAPLDIDEAPAPSSSRRSPTPASSPARPVSSEPKRRSKPSSERDNGSLLYDVDSDQDRNVPELEEGQMFGFIPAEIAPTRLPGTHESTPILLRVGVIVLVLLNLALAIVVMLSLLT